MKAPDGAVKAPTGAGKAPTDSAVKALWHGAVKAPTVMVL